MVILLPLLQMELFEPVFADGDGLTVITTEFVFVHPVAVTVSVKV